MPRQTTATARMFQKIRDSLDSYTYSYITPSDIETLSKLQFLRILSFKHNTEIVSLPSFIGKLHNLETLDLAWAENLKSLPQEIGDCINLKCLSLYDTDIRSLPSSIGKLQNLEELKLGKTGQLRKGKSNDKMQTNQQTNKHKHKS